MSLILKEYFGNSLNGNEYLIKSQNKILKTRTKSSSFIPIKDLFRVIFN